MMPVDGQVTGAVRNLLHTLGYDPLNTEGLSRTPERVAKMLINLCYPEPFDFTTFDAKGMEEMIVQSDIPMHSLCEHHMLPFLGTAVVGYIPDGRVVGLSKLARTVDFCSHGLKTQETITQEVADMIESNLHPRGVGVIIKARHLCMEIRGVHAPGVHTTTSELRGEFRKPEVRAEFLAFR